MKTFGVIALFLIPGLAAAQYTLAISTQHPAIQIDDDFIVSATVSNFSDEPGWIDFGDRDSDYDRVYDRAAIATAIVIAAESSGGSIHVHIVSALSSSRVAEASLGLTFAVMATS